MPKHKECNTECNEARRALEDRSIVQMNSAHFAAYLMHISNCQGCYERAEGKSNQHFSSLHWDSGVWRRDPIFDQLLSLREERYRQARAAKRKKRRKQFLPRFV